MTSMAASIKGMIKKTFLYQGYARYKNVRYFRSLSEEDLSRAAFYGQFVKPGDLAFDVGANMGNRTKAFLHLGAKTVAFEPQKQCADYLRRGLRGNPRFSLVEAALGEKEGEAEMMVSEAHVLSTLSRDWVKSTQESGRFSRYSWGGKQRVRVTTLDKAIESFGLPAFIKIDVEGYEFEVLSGLTRPVPCVSMEFAAEALERTKKCIDRLGSLAEYRFQFSKGESLEFDLPEWVLKTEIKEVLSGLSARDALAWGDVYAKKIEP